MLTKNSVKTLFIFQLFGLILFGQNQTTKQERLSNKLTFYTIDTDLGLSNNQVKSIEEDKLGFIWVGTSDGINRYDGNQFKVFRQETSNLTNNYIQQIRRCENGSLFVATDGGLNIFNPRTEEFSFFQSDLAYISNSINSVLQLKDHKLLVGAYDEGLHIFKNNKSVGFYSHQSEHLNSLSSNKISCLTNQNDSIVWIGTFDNGLNKLNIKRKEVIRYPYKNKDEAIINAVLVDQKNNVWVGTHSGLKIFTATGKEFHLGQQKTTRGLSDEVVLSLEEDDFGQIWIGTQYGGLNILDRESLFDNPEKPSIKWYLPKENNSSVSDATISALYKDSSGNMWIGTSAGLNFVDPSGEALTLISNDLYNSERIAHNRVFAIEELSENKLILGTDGGGIDLYDLKSGNFDYGVYSSSNKLSTNYINTIYKDSKDRLWIGTYKGGITCVDLKTQKWSYYLQGSIGKGSDIRSIFENKEGQLWVGTNRDGFFKYSESKKDFINEELLEKAFGKIDVRDITEDSKGTLWLATYGNGILSYDLEDQSAYSYHTNNLENLRGNVVYSITVLKTGEVVAGTKHGGLIRFNPNSTKAISITETEGLSNNTVNSIINWDDNYLWLATDKGINKYNIETNTIETINLPKSFQITEFNLGAILKSSSNKLFLGSNRGIFEFNPEALDQNSSAGPIVLEDLLIFNESVPISGEDDKGILSSSMLYKKQINIPYDRTIFSIDFTSLSFPFSENITYSYILEGFNENWIDLKNANRINFSNIPPGKYTLKIKQNNLPNATDLKTLDINILPPFWRTLPAYLFYLAVIIILVVSGLKYYSERIHLKNSLLFEQKQRKLEHELNEERIRFYTGFSHELKTPLTLILAPLETLLDEIVHKRHRKSLKLIRRNADNLLNFINKLLEFRKSEEGLSKLEINEYNLSKNLSQWLSGYEPVVKKKNINLMVTMPQKTIKVYCDLEKIHVIVNNLISNAIKYTPDGGKINVILEVDESYVNIVVSDTGSGIKTSDLNHIFEWYYQSENKFKKDGTGIGLALSRRFAHLHKGFLEVESKANQGSIFTLKIPNDDTLLDAYLQLEERPQINKKEVEKRISDSEPFNPEPKANSVYLKAESSRKLVLLVDDNPDILEFLESALGSEYDLIQAEDGEEGISLAVKYIPDLIISDVMMPVKSGLDLCQFIKNKKETSHIPVILLSAKSNYETIETGYYEGADDYIVKPFNVQVLRARVKNLIESREFLLKKVQDSQSQAPDNQEDSKILENEKKFLAELKLLIFEQTQEGDLSVETIAEHIGMSRSSLYRKVKAITGQSINEYIRDIRLEKAAYLIEKENFTVSQAAYEVGFGDAKYFRKIFKEKFGRTPSAFKQNPL